MTSRSPTRAGASRAGAPLHWAAALLPPVATIVILVVAWQVIVRALNIEVYVFPAPTDIWHVFLSAPSNLLTNAQDTALESLYGFLLGSAVGILLGVAFAYSRILEKTILPLVVASNAIPVIAIAPILILVLGEGLSAKVAVTAFLCFFPVCINAMKGLRSTPVLYVELMHVQAAGPWQSFWKVRVPASLPYVFVGLKVGATFAVIGAIVAEFIAVQTGLGAIMVQSNYQLDTPTLFAATIVAAALGVVFYLAVVVAERIVIPWHRETL